MSASGPFPYCDGETAESHAVELVWQDDGGFELVQGDCSQFNAPGTYTITDRIGAVPRFLRTINGGVIELPADFAAPGPAASGTFAAIPRVVYWLESRSLVAAIALALVVLIAGVSLWQGAPRLARRIAFAVPHSIEEQAGDAALRIFAQSFAPSSLEFTERARVYRQLALLTSARSLHVAPTLEFRTMGYANAFALPGGKIVVADELVQLAANDEEIAAVLAHELGHVERRHGLQSVLRNSAALLVVSTITGDLSTLSTFSATLPFVLLQYGYAREFESEADQYAMSLLKDAKIDPANLANILTALEASRPAAGADFSYLSTHPSTNDRIKALGGTKPRAIRSTMTGEMRVDERVEATAVDVQPQRIYFPKPQYPPELRKAGITGEVLVEFYVSATGDVVGAKAVKSTHPLLAEAAVNSVNKWKFLPGRKSGKAVNTRMQQPVTFSLQD